LGDGDFFFGEPLFFGDLDLGDGDFAFGDFFFGESTDSFAFFACLVLWS
jgi:hypothetical protein